MTSPSQRETAHIAVVAKPRLRPIEAVEYLERTYGLTYAEGTLMKMRCTGGGPAFRKFGRRVLYDRSALDDWAAVKLGQPVQTTADARQVQ